MPKVRIFVGPGRGDSEVWVEENEGEMKEISHLVKGFRITHLVGNRAEVLLQLVPSALEVEGEPNQINMEKAPWPPNLPRPGSG